MLNLHPGNRDDEDEVCGLKYNGMFEFLFLLFCNIFSILVIGEGAVKNGDWS